MFAARFQGTEAAGALLDFHESMGSEVIDMRTIVSKFGGSSTANAAQFLRILAIIRASPARRCIVLSAPGTDARNDKKITALLADCWRFRDDAGRLEPLVSAVTDRFSDIAARLGLPDVRRRVRDELARALSVSEACTLSRGEYLCALLFSRFSGIPMLDAADAIAFDAFSDVDMDRTREALTSAVAAGHGRVILPGFYGAGPRGEIRTFPKNGSDITGAIAAASLSAGLYENWTDVPGLMTADPAIVPRAKLIAQVSYRQMRLLARAGAQVLHPACLDPVAALGIPTRLRCTMSPEQFGTLISDGVRMTVPCVASKSCPDGTARVTVFGADAKRVGRAAEGLHPLSAQWEREAFVLTLPEEKRIEAVRALHAALVEQAA